MCGGMVRTGEGRYWKGPEHLKASKKRRGMGKIKDVRGWGGGCEVVRGGRRIRIHSLDRL